MNQNNRPQNRPQGRPSNATGTGNSIGRRGSGQGTGPVGQQGGYAGRRPGYTPPQTGTTQQSTGSNVTRARAGRMSPILIIIILIVAFFILRPRLCGSGNVDVGGQTGGLGDLTQLLSGYEQSQMLQQTTQQTQSASPFGGLDIGSLLGGMTQQSSGSFSQSAGGYSSGWTSTQNYASLDQSVDPSARAKYTRILGGGQDTVTVMVYMCGSDLESNGGMASYDIQEMVNARISDKVNVIVYTGGSNKWQNSIVSSSVNQIYKVESGGVRKLVDNAGNGVMTDPNTLTSFIKFCAQNYPANRNELILWDHGGGSITGYGYDEKNSRYGAMNLQRLSSALNAGGVKFDIIGYDACLMGTLENALTMAPYGDYLIASEETEPGIGWYYTDWLTQLSSNTSTETIKIGRQIIDDFITQCDRRCPGQKATLSIVDLAELEKTVPADFKAFAQSVSGLMNDDGYKTVSNARSSARSFAESSKSDQVDLVDLANRIGTTEGRELSNTLLGAVKYNKTSSSVTNAYGVSVYFPYQKISKVDSAVAAYEALGLDSEYSRCIQQFASMEAGGQAVYGGNSSYSSLLGSTSGGSLMGDDMVGSLLGSLFGGDTSGLGGMLGSVGGGSSGLSGLLGGSGLEGLAGSFLGRGIDADSAIDYITDNRFDPSALIWVNNGSGYRMKLTEDQWSLVNGLEMNVFYDDGEGYIDLGLDNKFSFDANGDLIGEYDGTWLAINNQPVAYYHMDTTVYDGGMVITGRVPVLLNDQRAELIIVIVYDDAHPYGAAQIAGARMIYTDDTTETVAKDVVLKNGDRIDFLCDYYTYAGEYTDTYMMGEQWVYDGNYTVGDVYIPDPQYASAMYVFTDIYANEYWTPVLP